MAGADAVVGGPAPVVAPVVVVVVVDGRAVDRGAACGEPEPEEQAVSVSATTNPAAGAETTRR